MEICEVAFLSLLLCCSLVLVLRRKRRLLPPGPPAFPIVGNLLWLTRPVSDIEFVHRGLRDKYGPIVTLHVGSSPTVMVSGREIAHKLLVKHGAVFANRPTPFAGIRFISRNQHNISAAGYGPLWRLLRRNLMLEILHPSRIKTYAHAREWVLSILLDKLRARAGSGDGIVVVMESFQYSMFCLLVFMCFGEKLDKKAIGDIEKAQRDLLMFVGKLNVFAFMPKFAKYVFRGTWRKLLELRQRQREIYFPLIRARGEQMAAGRAPSENSFHFSYVDSLLDLELPEENNRKLDEEEIIALCSEFLNAGTDTTSTALQWIMANVVKHQDLQERIVDEINGVLGEGDQEIREEDLHKFTYLKAVVMEGLRRHPPSHFVLPHAVTEEFSMDGYVIPKDATINFAVADINWDAKTWKEPMEFRPERFLPGGEGVDADITGSREVKMMPFGAGRRICPGIGLAMLHLEYFVANLVRAFEWKQVDGEEVDLTEKSVFTTVMKVPLRARITARRKI
ncbi:hypothetical protein Taro_028733 [Colocasia esculenta]|uniref:Cytochrome P450 89A2 n=1 Tax=Colocasia esculenta TaxID=4460 RepID=A0A843VLY5_COLES|nr:hypothetical protein [Colocasia esculenta]